MRKSLLLSRALRMVPLAVLSLVPISSLAVDVWEAHSGDPCCGIPDENYKYFDANEACVKEVPLPAPDACSANPRNMRNNGGPQVQDGCVYDTTCTCASCGVLPDFPNGGNTQINPTRVFTSRKAQVCPDGTKPQLGRCDLDSAKGKGTCQRDVGYGNPCNVVTGNKYQRETIYRAAAGGLELTLSYNSQIGSTYFQSGPFGKGWTSAYFVRLRASGQGIVGVEAPDGRELEFRAPAAGGNSYVADADIADKLERLLDSSGNLAGWRLTAADGDRSQEHEGTASLLRDHTGTLLRIVDRALVEHTMTYSTASTPASIAPRPGLLISVTDRFDRRLDFTYDSKNRVATMTDPAGGTYAFEYDGPSGPPGANNLTKVTFPGGKTRVYFYSEPAQINGGAACTAPSPVLPNALTGLQDENGARFATWTYDCNGRVTGSEHAGTERYTFTYEIGRRIVTDPLNTSRTVDFTVNRILGLAYGTGAIQPAANGSGTASNAQSYDAQGNVISRTDYNGNRTDYTYDLARNLETSRREGLTAAGAATPETRTITTAWHPTFRLPTQIAEPLRITTSVYDADGTACGARGALCSRTVQATNDADGSQGLSATPVGTPRTWAYTYNANGSVLTVNGPRTDAADVTTYTYYPNDDPDPGKRGNVATITNAAGHVTQITAYNAHGQPLTVVDANGVTTTLTYDERQRLKSRSVGSELTTYDYDGVGQLTKVTLPDGSFISYTYDAAHRLTGMQDNQGNRIAYTLDAMGNRTQEQVFDPANQLAQTRSRVYNSLNRLFQELGAQSQTTEYAYDNQGNVVSVKDPLNRVTSNQHDALNRLRQVIDPALAVTQYAYNGLDALTQVTDPRSLVTGYTVDGLGNLTLQSSPDTGNTASTYDAAGNLLTQADAKGQTTTYAYDALNRVTLITFHDGSKQAYAYDQGANGVGRLSSISETDPANQVTSVLVYAYDPHGRVTSEVRTVAGVQHVIVYSYDAAGRLSGITYPSGRTVAYEFDSLGRVSAISTTKDGETQAVVSGVAYHPFGGVKGFTFGNGQAYQRTYDQDGRIASYTLGSGLYAIGYDAASRIEVIAEAGNPPNTNAYTYDSLDRLTGAAVPGTPYAYTYDAVGNRLSKTVGSATETLAYDATSNRIASLTPAAGPARSFAFDPNGSTTSDGVNTYAYDVRGRMKQATSATGITTYQVNALGQRIRKSNSLGDTVFHYDSGGRLIAETDPGGTVKREIIYLGDMPVGVIQ